MNSMDQPLVSSPEASFFAFLGEQGRIGAVGLQRLRLVHAETADRLAAVTLKLGLMSEEDLAATMANFGGAQRYAASESPVVMDIAGLNPQFLRAQEIVPLSADDGELRVACWDLLDEYAGRALEFVARKPVRRLVATRSQVRALLDSLYPNTDVSVGSPTNTFDDDELDRLKDLASEAPIIRLVQRLIDSAVAARASDIHFEPSATALQVRFRLDGLLREIESQPAQLGASIVSRLKVMAGLNIAERRLPQDGRIRVTVQGKEIDFRVATSPTLYGESVVLRILDRQDVALDLDALGFDAELKSSLRAAIGRPHGIVLVTGPTGSGKTTTLYAALKEINTAEKKILTVEDPVEYVLAGTNQVPVKPQIGLTFANALRAFLRQDPDVLMVGEIRDRETAEIAVQAALTGHLLFSTLHTNSAAAAVTRLLDMGIDDYLLTSTLQIILGQRLVRKLCENCRQAYRPSPEVRARCGLDDVACYRPVGCADCRGLGYRGRTTIVEALPLSDAVRAQVLQRADAHQLERVAVQEGMRTLFRHGMQRVQAGATTLEEVLRVTSLN
jgi:general secretion pathway protein E